MITHDASMASILDLRRRMYEALPYRADVLLNIIDALTAGPRIATPAELALSPLWGFAPATLYTGLRAGAEDGPALERLREARRAWWEHWGESQGEREERLGSWRVYILDATDYPRPKAPTVERGFVHGAKGMTPGHGLSVLARQGGEGSWVLPLEMRLIPVGQAPGAFGAQQLGDYIAAQGWGPDEVVALDAGYTNAPSLRPMVEAGANVLGRVSSRRVFYLPPPPYAGRGRPAVRGRKIKLNDARTLPTPVAEEMVELPDKRRVAVSRWNDVRMRQWPEQPLVLYRVIEYRADGTRRFQRPLWLIYVGAALAPTPGQAQTLYAHRFGIEHSLRFLKGELGLVAGQFNGGVQEGASALARVQLWVEVVASALWLLFALRSLAASQTLPWPAYWRSRRLTPGAVRRLALAIFVRLGISAPQPCKRGKSPGRAQGTRLTPRKRYKIFRKRKRRTAT